MRKNNGIKKIGETSNFILYQTQYNSNRKLVIIGTGLTRDWRCPGVQRTDFKDCTIWVMYFKKGCTGLQDSGKKLASFINSRAFMYQHITFVDHSKCANMALTSLIQNMKRKQLFFTVSPAFGGTPCVMPDEIKRRLFEKKDSLSFLAFSLAYGAYLFYRYILFGNYPVDHDISLTSSNFKDNYKDEALLGHKVIIIGSDCSSYAPRSVPDRFLCWFDNFFEIGGDGVTSKQSQSYLREPDYWVYATHNRSLDASISIIQHYIDNPQI